MDAVHLKGCPNMSSLLSNIRIACVRPIYISKKRFTLMTSTSKPYPAPQIPIQNLDWEAMIPRLGMAQAAVARFDGILQAMINPELLLSPLTTQEAVLGSRIEGTQASLEDVLQYDVDPRKDTERKDDIVEVQNYREALREYERFMSSLR